MKQDEKKEKTEHELQSEADREKPKRGGASIVTYIAVLFAVAFGLLLLSYFMQQRNTAQVIQGLQSSVSAVEDLQSKNTDLYRQVNQLNAEVKAQQESNQSLKKQQEAMDLFWQIERLYLLSQYDACGETVAQMEEGDLSRFLPSENIHAFARLSPAQEYAKIQKALE
ncbi:MAG: hypothetical protein PHT34_02790 [Oscillospiraceae bacterium]|nr:hypothetical protein [Oscillospiraceae bacterium]